MGGGGGWTGGGGGGWWLFFWSPGGWRRSVSSGPALVVVYFFPCGKMEALLRNLSLWIKIKLPFFRIVFSSRDQALGVHNSFLTLLQKHY